MKRAAKPLRLLVIDDDEIDRKAVKRALTKGGIAADIEEASDVTSAKAALFRGDYDCVLLDFALPDGDGMELLRLAREAELETPIIMLTGQGDETLAVDLMKSGAGDYLAKSALSPARLVQSIRHLVRVRDAERSERRARAAIARQASQLAELSQLSVAVHATFSVEEAIAVVAHGAPAIFGAEVSFVLLSGAPSTEPLMRAWFLDADAKEPTVALAAAASEALLLDWQRYVRVTRAEMEESNGWRAVRDRSNGALDGLLAAKLTDRSGRSIGCVLLAKCADGDFAQSDESILAHLAQSTSVAIENARLYRTAQDATRARDDVLAIVSHDLRNPLNAVSMGAQLLGNNLNSKTPDKAREPVLIERIQRGAARMNRLIQDLLDASRIEGGGFAVAPAQENAAALVAEAIDALALAAEARGVHLKSAPIDASLVVLADRERILQVFSNLLGNALKFAPRESDITVRAVKARGSACFEVVDQGPGIEPANLGRLFDRFWKAEEASRDGAGLGLFIARGIVKAHGGTILAESQPGHGTTLRFFLPLAP